MIDNEKEEKFRIGHAMEVAIDKYWMAIENSCARHKIDTRLILAIGARESDWGLGLKPKGETGTGDWRPRPCPTKYRKGPMPNDGLGYGRGIMQIDYDWHEFARQGKWMVAKDNIEYAAWYLEMNRRVISKFIADIYIHDAMIASYNLGLAKVLKLYRGGDVQFDLHTTGGEYVSWIKLAEGVGNKIEREIKFCNRNIRKGGLNARG